MKEQITDLIYTVRSICESLRDRPELLEMDEELKDLVDDAEHLADEIGELDSIDDES